MGGPAATDDLREGHRTQVWLAADASFQDRLMDQLAELTGIALPDQLHEAA